jgi:hypothetical protein
LLDFVRPEGENPANLRQQICIKTDSNNASVENSISLWGFKYSQDHDHSENVDRDGHKLSICRRVS